MGKSINVVSCVSEELHWLQTMMLCVLPADFPRYKLNYPLWPVVCRAVVRLSRRATFRPCNRQMLCDTRACFSRWTTIGMALSRQVLYDLLWLLQPQAVIVCSAHACVGSFVMACNKNGCAMCTITLHGHKHMLPGATCLTVRCSASLLHTSVKQMPVQQSRS